MRYPLLLGVIGVGLTLLGVWWQTPSSPEVFEPTQRLTEFPGRSLLTPLEPSWDTLALAKTVWEPLDEGIAIDGTIHTWYPMAILQHHELLHDTVTTTRGREPILIVSVPAIRLTRVFAREQDEHFESSTKIINGVPLLKRVTEEGGEALIHPLNGREVVLSASGEPSFGDLILKPYPFRRLFWPEWVRDAKGNDRVLSYLATTGDLVDPVAPHLSEGNERMGPVFAPTNEVPWNTRVTVRADHPLQAKLNTICANGSPGLVEGETVWWCDQEHDRLRLFERPNGIDASILTQTVDGVPRVLHLVEIPTFETWWFAWKTSF